MEFRPPRPRSTPYRKLISAFRAGLSADEFSRQLLSAMLLFQDGDFGVRLPSDLTGIPGKIADAFNGIVAVSQRRARETARVASGGQVREAQTANGGAGRGWRMG
jgi:hypothetical protein